MHKGARIAGAFCLLFVDYGKAFGSFELIVVLRALVGERIDVNYSEIVMEANTACSININLFSDPVKVPFSNGVRHKREAGYPLPSKLFTACLEMV